MQVASVLALILLTYLLLVVNNAPIWLRGLGSVVVFFIFLRFQIGEELRRQRSDRIILLVSLFLLIASSLSLCVFSMKTLKQGEIYEGPARIVGYDLSNYNNTEHDPTTRTDIAVSWGKEWGCPLSGGKVCQARIQGAMCQVHPKKEQTKHKPSQRRRLARLLEDDLEEDLEEEEKTNQELESENENLEKENEELQQEVDELKQENEIEEEEVAEEEEEATSEIYVVEDEYGEEVFDAEEEVYAYAEDEANMEYEADEKEKQQEMNETDDPNEKEELQEEITEDEQGEELIDQEYEEIEEDYSEYAEEYDKYTDEDLEDFEAEEQEMENLEDEKEAVEQEVEQTESEIDQQKQSTPSSHGNGSSGGTQTSSNGEEESIAEEEEIAEEVEETEEEEIIEEYENSEYGDDVWYWDEYPTSYDDDIYEDAYWNYDWDSVWGEYACEDLFDSEVGSRTYDPNVPAGGDDEWPFIYIYGSCKTCEAYVLDYFAQEAFEELEDYEKQAVLYMGGAIAGFLAAILSYIKYRVMPTAENEIELLGGGRDGGVLA
jgi:hypothetical protein